MSNQDTLTGPKGGQIRGSSLNCGVSVMTQGSNIFMVTIMDYHGNMENVALLGCYRHTAFITVCLLLYMQVT